MSVNSVVQTFLCLIDLDITRIKIQFEHSLGRETMVSLFNPLICAIVSLNVYVINVTFWGINNKSIIFLILFCTSHICTKSFLTKNTVEYDMFMISVNVLIVYIS